MPLPASFKRDGFDGLGAKPRFKRVLIGTDGPSDSGKSEFALSAPGPGIWLCLDRGHDGLLDNMTPPKTRRSDYATAVITVPLATQTTQPGYLEYWKAFYALYKKALDNPDCRTVIVDGDSDSWELQRLAEFGKLTQVPPIMYTSVNAARRVMYARAFDSGKIVIATNKVKKEYKPILDKDGNPVLKDGKEQREFTGEMERQGFPDQDYLFHIQLRHMYSPARLNAVTKKEIPQQWGIRIMKCKPNNALVGTELWGADCTFSGLVQTIYPNVPLSEWGF